MTPTGSWRHSMQLWDAELISGSGSSWDTFYWDASTHRQVICTCAEKVGGIGPLSVSSVLRQRDFSKFYVISFCLWTPGVENTGHIVHEEDITVFCIHEKWIPTALLINNVSVEWKLKRNSVATELMIPKWLCVSQKSIDKYLKVQFESSECSDPFTTKPARAREFQPRATEYQTWSLTR